MKILFIVYFNTDGIVHEKFVPQEQTTHQHFYIESLQEDVWQIYHNKWYTGNQFLCCDNAPAHSALCMNFSPETAVTVVTQPPYSPGPVLCDFIFSEHINTY
jgi:hypothetical protein